MNKLKLCGKIQYSKGKFYYDHALNMFKQSLAVQKTQINYNEIDYADTLNRIGETYQGMEKD